MRLIRCSIVSIASLFLVLGTAAPHLPVADAALPPVAITQTADTYFFTMTLPDSASFTKLSLTERQQEAQGAPTPFDLPLTTAFIGTPGAIDRPLTIAASVDETGTVWVEFDRAIPAGTRLTVAFKERGALSSGNYDYGVAAYPHTAVPIAVFVGEGTLTVR